MCSCRRGFILFALLVCIVQAQEHSIVSEPSKQQCTVEPPNAGTAEKDASNEMLVADIMMGRWRSQTVHAAIQAGFFELLSPIEAKSIATIAQEAETDRDMSYRVLRAIASLGLAQEIVPSDGVSRREGAQFLLTGAGSFLRRDHPRTMADAFLLEEGEQHYALWKHLPAILKDGKVDGFIREYGQAAFEYAQAHPEYDSLFNSAMSSFSKMETDSILNVLACHDFASVNSVCDIAGGHGYLLSRFLKAYPHIKKGIVIDLPIVMEDEENHLAGTLGVAERCSYVGGDMFKEVPGADMYFMKHILHDWNDAECHQILANAHKASRPGARLFVAEIIVPGPNEPSLASFLDIHMATWGTGQERTLEEYQKLLKNAGWKLVDWLKLQGSPLSVIEAVRE